MDTQVTVTLPEGVYQRAEFLAQLTDRDVTDVLAETIKLSLSPLNAHSKASKPIATLSDEEVLSLTELQTKDELEDFVIVNHPEFKARRKQAKQAYQEGKTTDIDNLIQEIRDGRL